MESFKDPSTMVNTDFLRSGREFSLAANETDDARRFERPSGQSRHARLERFHDAMLAALAPSPTSVNRMSSTPSIVNVDFLRAGSNRVPSDTKQVDVKERTRHARLEDFHNQMLEVHKRKVTPANSAVIVNTDFLRSGKEFLNIASENSTRYVHEFKGRHARLEEFHTSMLQAYSDQPASPVGPAADASVDPPINLDFLRSGREFEAPTATTPESKRYTNFRRKKEMSRNEKLVDFHNAMLQAYAAAKSNTTSNPSSNSNRSHQNDDMNANRSDDPITVNLDFLRSGSEFHEPISTSPQVRRYNGFQTRGRHTRLEQFHDRMLQQHAATAN